MHRLRKFSRLGGAERRLVLRALAIVVIVRTALWVLPFRWLRDWIVKRAAEEPSSDDAREQIDRIAWAVASASKVVPGATCLTQALATQWLLSRRGIGSTLRLGVGRNETGAFGAHA